MAAPPAPQRPPRLRSWVRLGLLAPLLAAGGCLDLDPPPLTPHDRQDAGDGQPAPDQGRTPRDLGLPDLAADRDLAGPDLASGRDLASPADVEGQIGRAHV